MRQYFLSIRQFSTVIALFAAAMALASCGGNESEVTVETGSLSKAVFIKRADQICLTGRQQFNVEFGALAQKVAGKGPKGELAGLREAVDDILLPIYEPRIQEIADLGAPAEDEEQVALFLNSFQDRLEEIDATPPELTKTVEPFKEAVKAATTYGLRGCAESLS